MKTYIRKGLAFGTTSGVITVLGLISGLASGTHSKLAVIGGIITIAIADSFSDALGMHTSEESSGTNENNVWATTIVTFISKLILSSSFLIPVLLFKLDLAVIISAMWGVLVITLVGIKIAEIQKIKAWKVIAEHLSITIFVVIATNIIGQYINQIFA